MQYYKGQRLIPTDSNPIRYSPHDFAVFEGFDDGKLVITTIQRRQKTEPTQWWTAHVAESGCVRRCLALYQDKVSPADILLILDNLTPLVRWSQLPPTPEPLNPYRYEGFFNGESQVLELDPGLVNDLSRTDLESALKDIVAGLID